MTATENRSIEQLGWTWDMIEDASKWGFNCGPGALCAVLNKTPEEIRPHLRGFEDKGYTNPSLMARILRDLKIPFRRLFESTREPEIDDWKWPDFGLVRVQWSGPWTKPGVPIRVRYRHTHWIAHRKDNSFGEIFDVNCLSAGGWVPFNEWTMQVVPWLVKKVEPKSDGKWWPTHCWELRDRDETG